MFLLRVCVIIMEQLCFYDCGKCFSDFGYWSCKNKYGSYQRICKIIGT